MAHFSYIAREGKYTNRRDDLLCIGNRNMPAWAKDEKDFWNEVEKQAMLKNRGDVQVRTGRCWDFSLPNELNLEEQINFTDAYLEKEFPDLPYTWALHTNKSAVYKQENPHVHVMFAEYVMDERTRQLSREEFFKKHGVSWKGKEYGGARKTREFSKIGTGKLRKMRQNLADEINRVYIEKGLPQRVTEKSLKAQKEEALVNGDIPKGLALDRAKPIRLSPSKFKEYKKIISAKVQNGYDNPDISGVDDPVVMQRICQEYEKQLARDTIKKIDQERKAPPTLLEKYNAIKTQIKEMEWVKSVLPTRQTEISTRMERAMDALKKEEDQLNAGLLLEKLSDRNPEENYSFVREDIYNFQISMQLQSLEIESIRNLSEAEKIREYAVRLFAEQQAENRVKTLEEKFNTVKTSGDTTEVQAAEKRLLEAYNVWDFARIFRERAEMPGTGIDDHFRQAHKQEIQKALDRLTVLNERDTAQHKEPQEISRRQDVLDARIMDMVAAYKEKLSEWEKENQNVEFRKNKEWKKELAGLRASLEKSAKRPHASESVKEEIRTVLNKTEKTYDRIMVRTGRTNMTIEEEDTRLLRIENTAQRLEKEYIQKNYSLMPHRAEYYVKKWINEQSEITELKEKLRAQEALKQYNEKQLKETLRKIDETPKPIKNKGRMMDLQKEASAFQENVEANEKQIAELRAKFAEAEKKYEVGSRAQENMMEWAEQKSKESREKWPESRKEILETERQIKRHIKASDAVPAFVIKRLQKVIDKFENKTSREALLNTAVKEKFAAFQKEVYEKLPRSEKSYLLEMIRKESNGRLSGVETELKYLQKIKRQTPERNAMKHAELDRRIRQKADERSSVIAKYDTAELRVKAHDMRANAQQKLEETLKELRAKHAALERKDLNRLHLSEKTKAYCEGVLAATGKQLEKKENVLIQMKKWAERNQGRRAKVPGMPGIPKMMRVDKTALINQMFASLDKHISDAGGGVSRGSFRIRDRDEEMEIER